MNVMLFITKFRDSRQQLSYNRNFENTRFASRSLRFKRTSS